MGIFKENGDSNRVVSVLERQRTQNMSSLCSVGMNLLIKMLSGLLVIDTRPELTCSWVSFYFLTLLPLTLETLKQSVAITPTDYV